MEKSIKLSGFSLIQLLMVILLLVVLSATVYFKWSSTSLNLNSQTELLASDIRYTQNLSMSQNQRFRLVINTSTNSYQIQNETNQPVSIGSRGNTTKLAPGITFGTLTTITNKIIFDTKGVPYDDNPEVALTTAASISLSSAGKSSTITIYPETGRVTP